MRGEIIDILEETVHTLECTYYICLPFIKHCFPKRVATIQKKTDRHLSQIISLYKNFHTWMWWSTIWCVGVLYQLLSFLQCVSILVTYCVFSVVSFVALKRQSILPTNYMIKWSNPFRVSRGTWLPEDCFYRS